MYFSSWATTKFYFVSDFLDMCSGARIIHLFCCSNVTKDHRDKTEVPDPLVAEDLISYKLNNRRKLARLTTQYRDIFSNILAGTAFLLQGVSECSVSFLLMSGLRTFLPNGTLCPPRVDNKCCQLLICWCGKVFMLVI